MILIKIILTLCLYLWSISADLTEDLKEICDDGKESIQRNTLVLLLLCFETFFNTFSAEFPAVLRPHDKRIVNGFKTRKGLSYQLMLVIGEEGTTKIQQTKIAITKI